MSTNSRVPSILYTWICLFIAFAFFRSGCINYNIRSANKQVTKISAKELLAKPPERTLWVEIEGHAVTQSRLEQDKEQLVVFADTEGSSAVVVKTAKGSTLTAHDKPRTLRGMTVPKDKSSKPPPQFNVPAECRVANLVIDENATPPGWFGTWGLMIIGAFAFMAISNALDGEKST